MAPPWPAPVSSAGTGSADVSVALQVAPRGVRVGNDAVAVATVRNRGPEVARDVVLTVALIGDVVPAAPAPSRGSCELTPNVTCELGVLGADASVTVRIPLSPVAPGSHVLLAEVSTTTSDPRAENDSNEATLDASGPACDEVGTQGPDEIRIRGRGTVACGLRGGDVLTGTGGPQTLVGGSGNDVLGGGGGGDELLGGPGRDAASFRGGPAVRVDLARHRARGQGSDTLRSTEDVVGSAHDDVIGGSRGANAIAGLGGRDLISGAGGGDVLRGGPAADSLWGGRGDDRLLGGPGTDGCVQGLGRGIKRGCEIPGFALVGDIALFEPARGTVGYGFHESLFSTAMSMRPLGRLARNAHGGFTPPPPTDGPRYVVMDSRGRGTGPTTAVDIVVPSHARVRSPLTGTVVAVVRYRLYCQDLDWKVVIRPQGASSLRVLVLHLGTVRVDAGDDVAAGTSILGVARDNDASSAQANQYFPDGYPHVHVEVERNRASPTPGCAA